MQHSLAVCHSRRNANSRDLWRKQNSLQPTRPLIYLRGGVAWHEVPEANTFHCRDEFFREIEGRFRLWLYWASMGDDSVFEPWLAVAAVHNHTGWGLAGQRRFAPDTKPGAGSYKEDYPLKRLDDVEKLSPPQHRIDESATAGLPVTSTIASSRAAVRSR